MMTGGLILALSVFTAQLDVPAPDAMPVQPAVEGTPAPEPKGAPPPSVQEHGERGSWRADLAADPESRALVAAAPIAALVGGHLVLATLFAGAFMGITALPLLVAPTMWQGDGGFGDAILLVMVVFWVVAMPVLWLPLLIGEHLLSGVALVLAPVASALLFRWLTGTHRFPRKAFLGGAIGAGLLTLTGIHAATWVMTLAASVAMFVSGLVLSSAGNNYLVWAGTLLYLASPLPMFALPALAFTSLMAAAAAETIVGATIAGTQEPVPVN